MLAWILALEAVLLLAVKAVALAWALDCFWLFVTRDSSFFGFVVDSIFETMLVCVGMKVLCILPFL